MIDGTTSHGTQSLAEGEEKLPLSYYRKNTGVALVLQQLSKQRKKEGEYKNINAGFVGLGAGTKACRYAALSREGNR